MKPRVLRVAAMAVMVGAVTIGGTEVAKASPPSQPPTLACLLVGVPITAIQGVIDPYGLSQDPLAVGLRNLQRQACGY